MFTESIYRGIRALFSSQTLNDITDFLDDILELLNSALTQDSISTMINIFLGVGVSMMMVYFFMDLSNKASRDMITTDAVIISCIKLVVGCAIFIYLPDIIYYIFQFSKAAYDAAKGINYSFSTTSGSLNFAWAPRGNWPDTAPAEFTNMFDVGIRESLELLSLFIISLVTELLNMIASAVLFIFGISNAILFMVHVILSPLAVANCFEGGEKTEAIRYMKKLIARGFAFAVSVIVLGAGQGLINTILYNMVSSSVGTSGTITLENVLSVYNFTNVGMIMAVKLAAGGAIYEANHIASNVFGASDGH